MGKRQCINPSRQTQALFGRHAFSPKHYEMAILICSLLNWGLSFSVAYLVNPKTSNHTAREWFAMILIPTLSVVVSILNLVVYSKGIRRPVAISGLHPKYSAIICILQMHAWIAQAGVYWLAMNDYCYRASGFGRAHITDYFFWVIPQTVLAAVTFWAALRYLWISVAALALLRYGSKTADEHQGISIELPVRPNEAETIGNDASSADAISPQAEARNVLGFERMGRTADSNLSFMA